MNKKNLFCTVAVATMSAFIMSSCNKQDAKMDEKSPKTETKSEMKIAYIEIDSIMTQYNFCSNILE